MSRAATAALVVLGCLAAPAESLAQTPITIRVYDTVERPAAERGAAIAAAATIFTNADLSIAWLDCGRGGADYPCAHTRQPRDMVVRIVARATAADTGALNAITANDDADTEREAAAEPTLHLGSAAVTGTARTGVVATIYADHVRRVARRTGVEFGLLLGRAMAHEIGHLLPGSDGHTSSGLMRAVWTDGELRENRAADWVFSAGPKGPALRQEGPALPATSSVSPQTPRAR